MSLFKFHLKEEVDAEVKILNDLKKEFKALTGEEWKPAEGAPVARSAEQKPAAKAQAAPAAAAKPEDSSNKKQTR